MSLKWPVKAEMCNQYTNLVTCLPKWRSCVTRNFEFTPVLY